MESKTFIHDYFSSIEFAIWEKKVNFCMDQIMKLKKETSRRKYYIELYAVYLQLVEICCINIFVLSEKNEKYLLSYKVKDIAEKAKKQFKDSRFINYFLNNWVFGIQEKSTIQSYSSKRSLYTSMLEEAVEDYTKDFIFLNSYKHGFRVYASGSNSPSIERQGSKEVFFVQQFNAQIFCFYRAKGQNYKMQIAFNWQDVAKKSLLFLSALENMKKVYLAQGTKVKLDHYFVISDTTHLKHSGRFRVVTPL